MNNVTNLILSFSSLDDENSIIEKIKLFTGRSERFYITSLRNKSMPRHWYNGNLFNHIQMIAYHSLKMDGFLDFLRHNVEWHDPDLVQLFIKGENDVKFKVIDLMQTEERLL
ncbi:MAG TPA: hypothetical protein VM802_20040 [Chitinophaga sp.]|uniref:hypothetical protein n=1 Tax=Chitinophaga sp. TaxID=1869181 RepID=UPI002CB9F892|nr:hypothetical protein [Chitinophaga sp.]HVI47179.1 hypothetical protein [Chitinophaga sp.]